MPRINAKRLEATRIVATRIVAGRVGSDEVSTVALSIAAPGANFTIDEYSLVSLNKEGEVSWNNTTWTGPGTSFQAGQVAGWPTPPQVGLTLYARLVGGGEETSNTPINTQIFVQPAIIAPAASSDIGDADDITVEGIRAATQHSFDNVTWYTVGKTDLSKVTESFPRPGINWDGWPPNSGAGGPFTMYLRDQYLAGITPTPPANTDQRDFSYLTIPEPVTNLQVTGKTTTTISLSWDLPVGGSTVDNIQIDVDGDPNQTLGPTETTALVIVVEEGTQFLIEVYTVNSEGDSTPVSVNEYTLCAAPTGLDLSGTTTTNLIGTWADNSSTEASYDWVRDDGPADIQLAANSTSYNDARSITEGETIQVSVFAVNGAGERSDPATDSVTVPGTLPLPIIDAAVQATSTIDWTVGWTNPTDASRTDIQRILRESDADGTLGAELAPVSLGPATVDDIFSGPAGRLYETRYDTVNSFGSSAGNTVTVTIDNNVPVVSEVSVNGSSITAQIRNVADTDLDGYYDFSEWEIRQQGFAWPGVYQTQDRGGTTVTNTFTSLNGGTTYEYRVRIVQLDGVRTDWSNVASSTTTTQTGLAILEADSYWQRNQVVTISLANLNLSPGDPYIIYYFKKDQYTNPDPDERNFIISPNSAAMVELTDPTGLGATWDRLAYYLIAGYYVAGEDTISIDWVAPPDFSYWPPTFMYKLSAPAVPNNSSIDFGYTGTGTVTRTAPSFTVTPGNLLIASGRAENGAGLDPNHPIPGVPGAPWVLNATLNGNATNGQQGGGSQSYQNDFQGTASGTAAYDFQRDDGAIGQNAAYIDEWQETTNNAEVVLPRLELSSRGPGNGTGGVDISGVGNGDTVIVTLAINSAVTGFIDGTSGTFLTPITGTERAKAGNAFIMYHGVWNTGDPTSLTFAHPEVETLMVSCITVPYSSTVGQVILWDDAQETTLNGNSNLVRMRRIETTSWASRRFAVCGVGIEDEANGTNQEGPWLQTAADSGATAATQRSYIGYRKLPFGGNTDEWFDDKAAAQNYYSASVECVITGDAVDPVFPIETKATDSYFTTGSSLTIDLSALGIADGDTVIITAAARSSAQATWALDGTSWQLSEVTGTRQGQSVNTQIMYQGKWATGDPQIVVINRSTSGILAVCTVVGAPATLVPGNTAVVPDQSWPNGRNKPNCASQTLGSNPGFAIVSYSFALFQPGVITSTNPNFIDEVAESQSSPNEQSIQQEFQALLTSGNTGEIEWTGSGSANGYSNFIWFEYD